MHIYYKCQQHRIIIEVPYKIYLLRAYPQILSSKDENTFHFSNFLIGVGMSNSSENKVIKKIKAFSTFLDKEVRKS